MNADASGDRADLARYRAEQTAERKALAVALVELGVETPVSVTMGHVAKSSLADLRERVAAFSAELARYRAEQNTRRWLYWGAL